MKFEALGLKRPILEALGEQGYEAPTPIQEQAIPAALAGRDVLGCARTGTGKTCAFAAPILQRLAANQKKGRPIRALILTPTRELAIQIQECFEAYGAHLPLKSVVIFGGVGQKPQVDAIQSGCDILVATPGRLEDLHNQGLIDVSQLEIFVLDEADRMLDMGFIHDVKKILTWLPQKKQTLFFSATMPKEIAQLVDSLLHDPVRIAVDPVSSPVEVIAQSVYLVDKGNKTKLLVHLLEEQEISSALVFTRTKHGANRVAQDLVKAGIVAAAIHGNKSQTARQAALAGFKDGSVRVLVATDIAARGLDIEDLACVFNYNLPEVPETYVHRIGRTGRAGKGGVAISFCDYGEKPLLRDIEKLIGKPVPLVEGHPYPMQVFEAPVKDAKGRVVNPEDAEARAAARAKKGQRDQKPQAAPTPERAQPKVKKKQSKTEPAAIQLKPVQESQPQAEEAKPTKQSRKKKQAAPAQPEVQAAAVKPAKQKQPKAASQEPEPVEPSFGQVRLPEQRKYKRPERKPLSALDEIAPALPEEELPQPKYGVKRTGHLRNTFFTPEERAKYVEEEPEPFMDATSRLFSTRKAIPARYQTAAEPAKVRKDAIPAAPKPEPVHPKKKQAKKAKSAEPVQAKPSEATPPKKAKGQKKRTKAKAPAQPAAASAKQPVQSSAAAPVKQSAKPGRLLAPSPKRKRSHNRPPREQRSIYGAHKLDSTEHESLMKPYYLSDDK